MRRCSLLGARRSASGLALLLACALAAEAKAGLALRGLVLTADGAPLPRATVFIYTAKPRVGTSSVCASCYADCRKFQRADRRGRFAIRELSESLLFRVLVCAPGFEPAFVDDVDPGAGPITASLRRRNWGEIERTRVLRGRVLDPEGRPVIGAVVRPTGFSRDGMLSFGMRPGTDPLSVTDERGEFVIATPESGAAWFVQVEARGLAPRAFQEVPAGADSVRLAMESGAVVWGRVLHQGRPLAGLVVGIASAERRGGNLQTWDEIATDSLGSFTFLNVAPRTAFTVYGKLGSFAPFGALEARPLTTGPSDSKCGVGALEVGRGHRVTGRVILTDEKPLELGTRLSVSRPAAWDILQIPLGRGGAFRLENMPSEVIQVSVRVPGYRLSPRSTGFAGYAGITLGVDRDLVEIVLEPDPSARRPGSP